MTISKENKEFLENLIDYYISESQAYRQIAENYLPEIESVPDMAFGIIAGCVYSGFLQAYQSQHLNPGLEDMKEFHKILKGKSSLIKKSLIDKPNPDSEKLENQDIQVKNYQE